MADGPTITNRIIDGVGKVQLTDDAIMVIDKLTADLKAANDRASTAEAARDTAATAHADALAAKDAEITALKAQVADATNLDALVEDRQRIVAVAKRVVGADFDPKGKTNDAIRAEVVTKRLGDKASGKDATYIAAAFDGIADAFPADGGQGQGQGEAQADPIRDAFNSGAVADANDEVAKARQAMIDSIKNPTAAAAA
jgi:hypothetical protein